AEELGEVEALAGEAPGVFIVRHQLQELVPEHGHAARLEPDDRRPRSDLVAESLEDPLEVAAGSREEAVVVERPAAAESGRGEGDLEPGGGEDPGGRKADVRLEVL